MTIPPASERKMRKCSECIFQFRAYDEEGDCFSECVLCEYHFSKCKYNFTESEIKELIDQHNQQEQQS